MYITEACLLHIFSFGLNVLVICDTKCLCKEYYFIFMYNGIRLAIPSISADISISNCTKFQQLYLILYNTNDNSIVSLKPIKTCLELFLLSQKCQHTYIIHRKSFWKSHLGAVSSVCHKVSGTFYEAINLCPGEGV